jgi:glyoxylase-like metal-dependent hydrolase (beta-lactamase superfamily II)
VCSGLAIAVTAQQPPPGRGRGGALQLPPASQIKLPPIEQIQKVRDNLYVIPGAGGNTAVFVTATGVVLVDTKVPNNGQAILDRVRSVTDKPVTTIVNTHTHFDHVGSNEFFPANVEVVTHANTQANMARMEELKGKPNAMPDRTYKDRLTIGRGADQVDLYYFGPAHTNGDTFVVFPSLRTMHAGDVFPEKQPPLLDGGNGGSGVAYADTMEKAVKGIRNVDTVIPGHSAVTNWAAFVEYTEFNREFLNAVQAARKAGRTAEQAGAELKLPAKFNAYVSATPPQPGLEFLGSGQQRARGNVAAIYAELNAR